MGNEPVFEWLVVVMTMSGMIHFSERKTGFTVEDAENITKNMSKDFAGMNVVIYKSHATAYTPPTPKTIFRISRAFTSCEPRTRS